MPSEDGKRHFYGLNLAKAEVEIEGKNFYMMHRRHRTHVNTLCGTLILGTLVANDLDRDLLVSELI
jgi:hypothetical protein